MRSFAADDYDEIKRRMDELKPKSSEDNRPPSGMLSQKYTFEEAAQVARRYRCFQTACAWRVSKYCENEGRCVGTLDHPIRY